MKNSKLYLALLSSAAVLGSSVAAHADTGTLAGTSISNTASVSYTVNGSPQTTSSTTSTFMVDRKANFTVVRDQPGNTQVNLEDENAFIVFKVTNTTNGYQDFLLDPDQQNISVGILPGTDNFDVSGLKAYVDFNDNGVYDPGVDVEEYIDELAPDASATVFVVGNIPNQASARLAFASLHVTIAAGGAPETKGSALVETTLNLANADNVIDVVFADDDSDDGYLGDFARNGQGRAYGAFEIGTHDVTLNVSKTARVISDGVNDLFPKAIPGAEVEYCFVVHNATLLTAANNVIITDEIPDNTTYIPGSISVGGLGLAGVCLLNGSTEDDDDNDGGETDGYTGSYNSSTNRITATIPKVLGGTSIAASFRVKIN